MKKLLMIIGIILMFGCTRSTYKCDVKVIYINGDIDTIHIEHTGIEQYCLKLKIYETALFSNTPVSPCLILYKRDIIKAKNEIKTIACGVRRFEIIREDQ